MEYQILDQFSEVGDTFITIFTVSVPSLFGMFKSGAHQSLSERRRNNHIKLMIRDMTMANEFRPEHEAVDKPNNNRQETDLPENINSASQDTLSRDTVAL